jgi:hypothetical protein
MAHGGLLYVRNVEAKVCKHFSITKQIQYRISEKSMYM